MHHIPPLPPIDSFSIEVCSWLLPGVMWRAGRTIYVRHLSEFLLVAAGGRWHPERSTCPTWDDSTECRCMTEGA